MGRVRIPWVKSSLIFNEDPKEASKESPWGSILSPAPPKANDSKSPLSFLKLSKTNEILTFLISTRFIFYFFGNWFFEHVLVARSRVLFTPLETTAEPK